MRSPRRAITIVLLASFVASSACAGGEPTRDAGAGATSPSTGTPTPTQEGATMSEQGPAPSALVKTAVADLAARLDVAAGEITVVSAEAVTWGDTSLGCPQPGMRYAQVVQDGTYIELEHGGTTYPYHSGGERPDPFLCEQRSDKDRGTFDGTLTPRDQAT